MLNDKEPYSWLFHYVRSKLFLTFGIAPLVFQILPVLSLPNGERVWVRGIEIDLILFDTPPACRRGSEIPPSGAVGALFF